MKLTRFDAADFLKDRETQQFYLEEFLADGDTREILRALGTIARAQNMSQVARDTGMSRVGLLKALGPEGNPSFDTINRVAKALGMSLWFKKGGFGSGAVDCEAGTACGQTKGRSSEGDAVSVETQERLRAA